VKFNFIIIPFILLIPLIGLSQDNSYLFTAGGKVTQINNKPIYNANVDAFLGDSLLFTTKTDSIGNYFLVGKINTNLDSLTLKASSLGFLPSIGFWLKYEKYCNTDYDFTLIEVGK
jgi:hypothetical protein